MPVLLHPHWGLFSDARQILEYCRYFFTTADSLPVINSVYRLVFNFLLLAVWQVSPNNPFGFYLFRASFFAGALIFTYLTAWVLSRSRLLSFLISLLWFSSTSTYEVIYTLDKGEVILAFLSQ